MDSDGIGTHSVTVHLDDFSKVTARFSLIFFFLRHLGLAKIGPRLQYKSF